MLAANAILQSGDDSAKTDLLPGIASGETRATLAFTEESGRWDEGGITMQATESGGSWTLDGTKITAEHIPTPAPADDGDADE